MNEDQGNSSSCLSIFYGLYIPTECTSNDIKMAEDDHLPDNTKCMDVAEDIEAGHGKRRDFE